MNSAEYQKLASKTESTDFPAIADRIKTIRVIRLIHGAIGAVTESAEILDQLKKHIFYGKALDTVNVSEEIGDAFWYLALLANELGEDFDAIMETNIAKLKKRYGDKFSEQRAVKRNLDIERKILEGLMRPARADDDPDDLVCDQCGEPCTDVPFYCMYCGVDLAVGGGVVAVAAENK